MAKTFRLFLALFGLAFLLVAQNSNPIIKGGDVLKITGLEEDLTCTVKPDGTVILPLVGDVKAEGLSLSELARKLNQAYSKFLRHPNFTVRLVPTAK
jgi:protein involved in polysaccharide export with SLBB domain